MSRIVKSIAVVDARPPQAVQKPREPDPAAAAVIKPRLLKTGPAVELPRALTPQEAYIQELNKIRVEIQQSRAELRAVKLEIDESKEKLRRMPVPLDNDENSKGPVTRGDIMENARREAERLLQQAQAEGEALAEQARNEGYMKGFSRGTEEAMEEYREQNQPYSDALQQLVESLSSYEQDRLRANQAELVQLACAVAEKIVGRELQTDPAVVKDMLWELVDRNNREDFIKITLAPDLLPVEAQASEEIKELLAGMGANITVRVDKDARPGSLMAETPKGYTDLSVATQLENIQEALTHA